MADEHDQPQPTPVGMTPTAQELKGAIDSGRTGDKVAFPDPGAAPLGTDDEAAGTPDTADRVVIAMREELGQGLSANTSGRSFAEERRWVGSPARSRPRSPNIQIYRPQLTSVLSIFNRLTGILLSACAVMLVIWLVAAATGPQAYGAVQSVLASGLGQIMLFGATFAFFVHFCGGIRHLVWDTGHGFELRSVYISGWAVVMASVVLTVMAWALSLLLGG